MSFLLKDTVAIVAFVSAYAGELVSNTFIPEIGYGTGVIS